MIRHRLASVALAAGLVFLVGCSTNSCSTGTGFGHGEFMQRLGFGHRNSSSCECMPVSSGGVVIDGGNGPYLEPQGPTTLPPGVGTEPPIAPAPRPFYPQQAQPTPAGPVSKVK